MNEITQIFNKDDISIYDVLDAAKTKWNFLPFSPGLVGGHCIGVDPYYLASYAESKGQNPRLTLAGRHTNDETPLFFANLCHKALDQKKSSILVLGLTFKENIPDLRNTKIASLVRHLTNLGHAVDIVDPSADPKEAQNLYGLTLISLKNLSKNKYSCIVGAVSHNEFVKLSSSFLETLGTNPFCILDIKNMWSSLDFSKNCRKITL